MATITDTENIYHFESSNLKVKVVVFKTLYHAICLDKMLGLTKRYPTNMMHNSSYCICIY